MKAAYNVTQFGFGQAVDLNPLPITYYSHFNDDTDNTLTCSDRVCPLKRSAFQWHVRCANWPAQIQHPRPLLM